MNCLLVAFLALALPGQSERPPASRVIASSGKVEIRKTSADPIRLVRKGDEVPQKAAVRCGKGAWLEIRTPAGLKVRYPKKPGNEEFERVAWRPHSNPRIERAYAARWEVGSGTRGGDPVNMWFPLDGRLRPSFAPFFSSNFPTDSSKGTLWIKYGGIRWDPLKEGDTVQVSEAALTDLLQGALLQHRKSFGATNMIVHVKSGESEFVSSVFNVLSEDLERTLDADLKELAAGMAGASEAELLIARAGILNSYELRTEAVAELEKSLKLDPKQPDVVEALKAIYGFGGRDDKSVRERLLKLVPGTS